MQRRMPGPCSTFAILAVTAAVLSSEPARGQTACGQNSGPDVILSDINGIANYAVSGGIDAVSFGDVHCNLGTAPMGFSANTNQHPVSGGALYRLREIDGSARFEQLGQGWLLHGFFALSSNQCGCGCTPTSGNFLGVGCSDSTPPRSPDRSRASVRSGKSTRSPASSPSARQPAVHGSVARRVQVHVDDLEPTGGPGAPRYFAEKVMIAPDEATAGNGKNNASCRELSASVNSGEWTFQLAASTQREKPAVRAWQDVDPSVQIVEVQVPGEGTFLLAWQTADLGDGRWHYEYGLYNVNSDLSAQSFAVPVPANVALFEPGFHDVDYHSGDGIGDIDQSAVDWSLRTRAASSAGRARPSRRTRTRTRCAGARCTTSASTRTHRRTAGKVTIELFKQAGSVRSRSTCPRRRARRARSSARETSSTLR